MTIKLMRFILLLSLAIFWIGSVAMGGASESADTGDGIPGMSVSADEKAWLNGTLLQSKSKVRDWIELKPDDTLIIAKGIAYWDAKPISERTFESYHLDRIARRVAFYSERIYSVRTVPDGREGIRILPGRLVETRAVTENLWVESLPIVDGGPWDGVYPIGYHLGQSARTK